MAETDGGLVVPRRITLGNVISMVTTIAVGAFIYGTQARSINALSDAIDKIPSTYARQTDLNRLQMQADQIANAQKTTSDDVQRAIADILAKLGDTNITLAKQAGVLDAMKGNISDIKDALKPRMSQP